VEKKVCAQDFTVQISFRKYGFVKLACRFPSSADKCVRLAAQAHC